MDFLSSNYNLVSFVSRRAVNFVRMFSPMRCNVLSVASDIKKLLLSIRYLTVFRVRTQFVIMAYLKTLVIYELLALILLLDNVTFLSNSEFHKSFCDLN